MNGWAAGFHQAIDRDCAATDSVVLRYRKACRVAAAMDADADPRFDALLAETSIREGLRVVPLFRFRGVEVDILDATSRMHTRTLKSIDGCVTTAHCRQRGLERIVFESGGNTGSALTVYGGRAGLETFLFVPTDNLPLLHSPAFAHERAHVIAVDDPRHVKPAARAFAAQHGIARVPQLEWRYQASAFVGCFVLEHLLAGGGYDHIVQAISAAFAPIGIYRALEPCRELLGGLPRFLGVQQAANCPMVRAWRAAEALSVPELTSTAGLLAKVMYDGEPRTYGTADELRRILVATGGDLLTLDHAEFDEWLAVDVDGRPPLEHLTGRDVIVGQRGGEIVEKTGLMALAATLREIVAGRIAAGGRVLVCLTGGTALPDGLVQPDHHVHGGADEVMAATSAPPPAHGRHG